MNTNQKTRLKAEDMEWNVLKTLGLSKEQLEADGSMERLLQGMETEAIPLKFRTPVIDLSMDATLRLVPGPGNQGNQPGKGTGSIRRKKSDTYSVPDGTEYIKRKKEYDCNID